MNLLRINRVLTPLLRKPLVLKGVVFAGNAVAPRVVSQRVGNTQYITMTDRDNANRLSRKMIQDLNTAFHRAEADSNVKRIVLESAHEKYFSPGADVRPEIKALQQYNANLDRYLPLIPKKMRRLMATAWILPSVRSYALSGLALMNHIARSPKVTVALVDGWTIGGGVELGLVCDYMLASPKARFALPEVKYGLSPDWGSTERLPSRIGRTLSRFMILEGGQMADKGMDGPATLSAEEAFKIGLVDAIAPSEQLDAAFLNDQYALKSHRPTTTQALDTLDKQAEARVAGTRLAEKYQRYKTTPLAELQQHELKGLYSPTLQMANRRIDHAPQITRFTTEKDLITMFIYSAKVLRDKKLNRTS